MTFLRSFRSLLRIGRAGLALGAGSFALAEDHAKHTSGHGDSAARAAQAELSVHGSFDANDTLWVAHRQSGRTVLRHSKNFGATWSEPSVVSAEPVDSGADARAKVVPGPRGELYVTWTRPMTKPFTGEIRLARSVNGGRSFEPAITVHADRQEITHRFDTLAVDREGRLFVAWIDKRDLAEAQAKKREYRGAALYFAVSEDRGQTFRGDYKVIDHACECCRIALVTRHDNSVAALWRHIFPANIRDHAVAQLRADGSASPIERASFDDWRIDACPHQGPALAEDGNGALHAVWFTGGTARKGVFYGRPGPAASKAARQIGGALAERPDLAASGQRVAIAWKEFDGERTQLRGLISDDAGGTWSERRLGSTAGASDHPRVLALRERFYVLWNTRNEPLRVVAFQ